MGKEVVTGSIWRDVTSQQEMESLLIERNKRHLQQTEVEGGASTKSPLTDMRRNYGFNETSQRILEGTYEFTENESDELIAFFKALQQTEKEK